VDAVAEGRDGVGMSVREAAGALDITADDLPGLLVAVLCCEVAGTLPGFVTAGDVASWYPTLAKPAFTPPSWVFGPVWVLLFALLGVAAYLIHRDGVGEDRGVALRLFVGQFALNVSWTLAFFGGRSIVGGLVVIVALWIAVVATVVAFDRVNRAAALLLLPYLAWVTFAAVLNVGIWWLN